MFYLNENALSNIAGTYDQDALRASDSVESACIRCRFCKDCGSSCCYKSDGGFVQVHCAQETDTYERNLKHAIWKEP